MYGEDWYRKIGRRNGQEEQLRSRTLFSCAVPIFKNKIKLDILKTFHVAASAPHITYTLD